MALDESFKRPGTIPFKWEVQPGIPKEEAPPAAGASSTPATPRLAPPPAARPSALAPASCRRRTSSSVAPAPVSPPSHRRSMSARFATSLALPFTRRTRRGRPNDGVDFCLLYSDEIA
ncbi:hypothetical protein U9M48_011131 [Paspalum notatum var. saurae]|uniref:Uncharacterized protein n=1 Tax=Paspalum notatum var. saurae TaxID=547442 RepID=A0AAQ3WGV4_PASNO